MYINKLILVYLISKRMNPSVYIKMKPYLVGYAKCKMGTGTFSNDSIIVKIVKLFARRITKNTVIPKLDPKDPSVLEINLPLLSNLYINDNKVYIHPDDFLAISKFYEAHFNDALYSYVIDKYRYHGELIKCFHQFCDDYEIPWEYVNQSMLKQKFYRFRRKKEEKRSFISSHSVPNLSLILPFLL